MINRILIRMKAVQTLYSYLLTRTEFKIATEPQSAQSADKRFAYRAYIDMLLMLMELTGNRASAFPAIPAGAVDKHLKDSTIGTELAGDIHLKNIIFRETSDIKALAPVIQHLHDAIVVTTAFKDYARKRKLDLGDEVKLWSTLFRTTIAKDDDTEKAFRDFEGFTAAGYRHAIQMVDDTLQSYYNTKSGYTAALTALNTSLEHARDLYMGIFGLIVALTRLQEERLENAKTKYLASAEDRNPDTRFIDNALAARLAKDPELEKYLKDNPRSFTNDITLTNALLDQVLQSTPYQRYMQGKDKGLRTDYELWRDLLKDIIFRSDDFVQAMEDRSVYWNDDLMIIGSFVLKTIRQATGNPDNEVFFMPAYKDTEDERFGEELFRYAVQDRQKYRTYIDACIDPVNWDPERIAFMDIIIMTVALAEILHFPNIPIAVSMNEYVDIANIYSSPKSGQFINGVLYKIIDSLKQQGDMAVMKP